MHAETVHRKIDEAECQRRGSFLDAVVTPGGVNELRVRHNRMFITATLLLHPRRGGVCRAIAVHQVIVHILSPRWRGHQRGLVIAPNNVPPEDVPAVGIPDVRVQTGIDDDVVLDQAAKTFAVLDTAAQTEIVGNDVIGGTIIEVDVPAVVATPAVVGAGWLA